jgi:hypothetical protein
MEVLGCLFFNAVLVVGWWLSVRALARLFAALPIPHWLGWPLCALLSIVHGFLLMGVGGKLLEHGLEWREWWEDHDIRAGAGIWLVSAAACVIACITHLSLAPLRAAVPAEQCLVGAAGFGFWALVMHKWSKRIEADSLPAAQPPSYDDRRPTR